MFPTCSDLRPLLLLWLLVVLQTPTAVDSERIFTIINDCNSMIWPAVTPGGAFDRGGFPLKTGQSVVFTAPIGWSGRIWGRTGCDFDPTSNNGTCQTGGCGSTLLCVASGEPPATLAEFTLASPDFYDVSLVDGFNLPIVITPVNGRGNCSVAGCDGDLRRNCPAELALKRTVDNDDDHVVACRSACDVFDTDEYCCRGVHGNPLTCQPTYYSRMFKKACPAAYSYAYDDPTSIFTCSGADYIVTFCSKRNQTVCTFHDNKLICSGGGSSSPATRTFLGMLLLFVFFLLMLMK